MPVWPVANLTQQASAVSVVNANETAVVNTSPYTSDGANRQVTVDAEGEITTGTGTTALVVKIRRGTTTAGAQVGQSQTITVPTAGNKVQFGIQVLDTPGEVAGQQYCCTVTQTGGTGSGTVDQVCISAVAQ